MMVTHRYSCFSTHKAEGIEQRTNTKDYWFRTVERTK